MSFEDQIKAQYQAEQGRAYHDAKHNLAERAHRWVVNQRRRKITRHVRESDHVLEYGVGSGWNLAGLKCARKMGYDLSTHLKPVLENQNIDFIENSSEVEPESVDVVICHHMLEHASNPSEVLQDIRRMLKPDGRVLLFVPYERESRYRQYDPDEPNHHLYSWNVQTLGNLVESLGFSLKEGAVRKFGYDRFASSWSHRLRLGEVGYRTLRGLLHTLRPCFEVVIVADKSTRD